MPSGLPQQAAVKPETGWQVSVLLVDDQPANLVVLKAVLDGMGYHLVDALSGEAALQRTRETEFAVILLDVLMPGMDGFQTASRIRSQERSRHTPIIFISAYERDDFPIARAYSLGAVDYLVKPLVPEILRAKVAGLVELYEQKQQVKQQGELLRILIEGTTDHAIFMLDPTGRVVTWNPGAERIYGYRAEEIIGRHFSQLYPEEDTCSVKGARELEQALASGKYEEEGWRLRKDGSRLWTSVVLTPLRDETGKLRGFSKVTRDVTERKRAEENARRLFEEQAARRAVRENEERLRFALTAARMIAWDWDLASGQCVRSDTAASILGLANSPMEDFFRLVHPDDQQRVQAAVARAVRGEGTYEIEFRVISPEGRTLWLVDRAEPQFDADGRPTHMVGVCVDITSRKLALVALQESEQRFRQLANAMPQIVWTTQADGTPEYLNQRWYEYTGLAADRPEEVLAGDVSAIPQAWRDVVYPDDLEPALQEWQEALRAGQPLQTELRLREHRTGVYRWHLVRGVPVRAEAGRVLRWYGTATNIDEHKRAEQSSRFLAQASAMLATLVDYQTTLQKVAGLAVPSFADCCAVHVLDADGSLRRLAVAHASPARLKLAQVLGQVYPHAPDDLRGPAHVLRTGQSEMLTEIPDELLHTAARDEEHLRLLREMGLKSYISVPIRLRDQTLGAISFGNAESGRSYSAADLRLAEDLAHRAAIAIENARLYSEVKEAGRRKDEFLAMLAHELRNPLAPIRNALQIMKMPGANAATIEQARQMTERQVQHMVRLVDDLLDVSRIMRGKIELRKEPIELAGVVARAVETAQPVLDAHGQEMIVTLPPEPVRLDADPTRLTQVVGNLLHNAAKYSSRSGRVWLSAECEDDEVVLRVKDEGMGMRPDLVPHVFDLFVQGDRSLERSQGGLGIGLTVVRKLVEMHGGSVSAHSAGPGQGSEFTIRLPRLPETHPPAGGPRSGQVGRARQGRQILVVDDNVDAAESMGMLLQMWGHQVRLAHTGPDALKAVSTFEPEIVILDIGLPGMNGYDVARQLRQQPRFEKTVLAAVTGYGQDEDRRRSHEAGFNYHLTKPVDPDTLLRLVAGVLGRRN